MRVEQLPTFCQRATILNRRKGKDSPDRLDLWKKTVLDHCAWSSLVNRAVNGIEVSLGASLVARVPQSDDYRPYEDWKESMDGFTVSTGDYFILGEVPEDVTPETVTAVVEAHRPDAFCVKVFKDNTAGPLAHYRIEGI